MNLSTIADWSSIVQAVIALIALVVAGGFAIFKFRIFRPFEPHLSLSQEVSHRFTDGDYVHLAVTVMLNNNSKVRVTLNEAFVRFQQVRPIISSELESLYAQAFTSGEYADIQWRVIDEFQRTWPKNTLIIEPGETHQEVYEFIVASSLKTILVYTFFYNSKRSSNSAEGWAATTIHDIV